MMDDVDGWALDDKTLTPVVRDRDQVLTALAEAGPLDRLFYLNLLDRRPEAHAEAAALLADPPDDSWRLLLLAADLHRFDGDFELSRQLQDRAWRQALTRGRQAVSLQHMGKLCFDAGALDEAAARFELAWTLRRGFDQPELVASSEQALRRVRELAGFDAIVLAGGAGVRLGGRTLGAKALIRLGGWPLADHVLLATSAAGHRIQVGPTRIALAEPSFVLEDPPGAGPVAAIAAGLARVTAPLVAVLAGDLPFVGPALASLRRAAKAVDVAALVDPTGRTNYLAAVWQTDALRASLARLTSTTNAPMRALYDGVEVAHVPDFDAASADVDTPDDLAVAADRLRRRSPGRLPASPLAWPRLELHAPS